MWMVTGGNGNLGRGIVEHLVQLAPSTSLAVGVRDPSVAFGLRELGVEVRAGDFEDAGALATAFSGVQRLLLVSTNGMPHETRFQHHAYAAEAAVRAGVEEIVYTSLISTAPDVIGKVHRQTEEFLRGLGVRVIILRNPLYLDNLVDALVGESSVEALCDGPLNAAWRSDLAEAAARVFVDPGRRDCYDFTGPEAFRTSQIAAEVAAVTGVPMPFRTLTEEEFLRQLAHEGVPEFLRKILLDLQHTIRDGGFGHLTDDLAEALGRPPRSMSERVRLLWSEAGVAGD